MKSRLQIPRTLFYLPSVSLLWIACLFIFATSGCENLKRGAQTREPPLLTILSNAREVKIYRLGNLGVFESKPFSYMDKQHYKNVFDDFKLVGQTRASIPPRVPIDIVLIVVDQDKSEHDLAYSHGLVFNDKENAVLRPIAAKWLAAIAALPQSPPNRSGRRSLPATSAAHGVR